MIRILLKSVVLFLIVLSVYFIVHPSACSNLLAGRETVAPVWTQDGEQKRSPMAEPGEEIKPVSESEADKIAEDEDSGNYTDILDTNTRKEEPARPVYSQSQIDYAIASRYVELEQKYTADQTVGKDASQEIAHVVMDDFQMTPTEWDEFISRATSSDLFNKVRGDMASRKK